MATRSRLAVGSMPWIVAEKENAMHLLQQEKEELLYPAQHEMEWLNEHMAEIFAKSKYNVAEVFKTPGKLRGKTPRTGRKKNAEVPRMPLSDIFSSNTHASSNFTHAPRTHKPAATFNIAQGDLKEKQSRSPSALPKQYTDSGYHGSTGDEMEVDSTVIPLLNKGSEPSNAAHGKPMVDAVEPAAAPTSVKRTTTEGSFHSADEHISTKASRPELNYEGNEIGDHGRDLHSAVQIPSSLTAEMDSKKEEGPTDKAMDKRYDLLQELEEIGSPSDSSTPDHPLVRKSSLTFASLPPREPLTTKRSIGARESRASHLDHGRNGRGSHFAKRTSGLHLLSAEPWDEGDIDQLMTDPDEQKEIHPAQNACLDSLTHSKPSTQTLHEKIDMLGKSQASRPSKSIPPAAALAASNLRKSEAATKAAKQAAVMQATTRTSPDEDDDWIKPLEAPDPTFQPALPRSQTTDVMEDMLDEGTNDADEDEMEWDMRAPELIAHEERMRTPAGASPSPGKTPHGLGHTKSASTATLASPGKVDMAPQPALTKSISVSNPPHPSTTPQGSPRRILEAPLSASKSRLQSIMKTAKGLFTSSAGVSAAAKMENMSSEALDMAARNMPGLYPNLTGVLEDKPLPPDPPANGRKTRSSTEREKEEKRKERERRERQQAEEQLEMVREKEKQIAAQNKTQGRTAQGQTRAASTLRKSPRRPLEEHTEIDPPVEHHEMPPPTTSTIQGKAQRPSKPTREPPTRNRPQPMSIRVGSILSHRMPVTNSSLASNLQETLPAANTRPGLVRKKASNASLTSAPSNTALKSSGTTQMGKPKALLAAERKKEADEREAQRKLEQKREAERKRVAHQEEARRQEQRQRAEAERKERDRAAAEQTRKNMQQQAIEKRRQEQARKLEQQRHAATGHDLSGPSAPQRSETGASRPPSRMGATSTLGKPLVSHHLPTNPAKPPKRPHEDESGPNRPLGLKQGGGLQQPEAKRRRTEDEGAGEAPARPTISGAPIRQSNMGKKPSVYPPGYAPAPHGPAMNHSQHQCHLSSQSSRNKMPFADAPNPPAGYPSQHQTQKTPSSSTAQSKPLPQLPSKSTLQLVKSSPQPQAYTPGENISLPEIPTDSDDDSDDSEDDDSNAEHGFPAPSWVSPTTLTNQLIAQESTIDGDAVFGPIAPLKMEEMFNNSKGSNKDRLKKFRERTSSANWILSGDGLTMEEVRADREMRERMRLQGGWRYGS